MTTEQEMREWTAKLMGWKISEPFWRRMGHRKLLDRHRRLAPRRRPEPD